MDSSKRDSFDAFARARIPALLRFGFALTGDEQQAADLVQDALARTIPAWSRLDRIEHPEAYVRRVMVNRLNTVWRRRRREVLMAEPTDRGYEQPQQRDAAIWAALAGLPRRQRIAVVLRYYEDLSEEQTAAVMGCTIGTVKSQTSKALAKLRRPEEVALIRSQESQS